jgi:hypothetical protein
MNKPIQRQRRNRRPARALIALILLLALSARLSGLAQPAAIPAGGGGPAMAQRVFVMGDSMGELVAYAMKKELKKYEGTSVDSFISLGSGLARNDIFDWPAKLRAVTTTFRPEAAVVVIGMTDNQNMKAGDNLLAFGTPEWIAEYGRRVRDIADIFQAGGTRTVLWVGIPDVRDPQMDRDMKIIAGILEEQTASKPGSGFMDVTGLFSKTPGEYSPYIIQKNGMPLNVRSSDGKHFSPAGAELLARAIVARLEKELQE